MAWNPLPSPQKIFDGNDTLGKLARHKTFFCIVTIAREWGGGVGRLLGVTPADLVSLNGEPENKGVFRTPFGFGYLILPSGTGKIYKNAIIIH